MLPHVKNATQFAKGKLVAGTEFGGGREFPFPDGSKVRSGNITPDNATGIGNANVTPMKQITR